MKVLLLGGAGFLGTHFHKFLTMIDNKFELVNLNNLSEKFNKSSEIHDFLSSFEFDIIINCIAAANIGECETNPELAYWLNSEIPKIIANSPILTNKILIHFSTDAVFGSNLPFKDEKMATYPISIYGKSKLLGEKNILRYKKVSSYIFRVNFFGESVKKNSLFDYFYENLNKGKLTHGFDNVYFTPLYVEDLVKIVMKLSDFAPPGIYHLVGPDRISKYEFGLSIAKIFNVDKSLLVPCNLQQKSNIRLLDLSLDSTKVRALGIKIPGFQSGLERLCAQYRS